MQQWGVCNRENCALARSGVTKRINWEGWDKAWNDIPTAGTRKRSAGLKFPAESTLGKILDSVLSSLLMKNLANISGVVLQANAVKGVQPLHEPVIGETWKKCSWIQQRALRLNRNSYYRLHCLFHLEELPGSLNLSKFNALCPGNIMLLVFAAHFFR